MINFNFIKQSPTVDEIIEDDIKRVETMQEESDDEMRLDTLYSPDEGSDATQSTVISDGQENNKKDIDLMYPHCYSCCIRSREDQRSKRNLPARCNN